MIYILIFCTLAIGHSLFLAVALLTMSAKLSNRLLAVLLILLSVRIGKSVVQMFLRPDMSYVTSCLGVIAMAGIGPVLYLLVKDIHKSNGNLNRIDYVHFAPVALLPLLLLVRYWSLLSPIYFIVTFHLLIYIVASAAHVYRNREIFRTDDLKWNWSWIVLGCVSVLWCSFLLQITNYHPIVYATNVITAAVAFYMISLWALKRSRLFLPDIPAKAENIELLQELGQRIEKLFDNEHIYIDPSLNVSAIASRLKVPSYLVSKAVNHYFQKSFSEMLVTYRINQAEQLLVSANGKNYTIEAIAFESGFNTLSAFYAAFKKIHKTTPARYRESSEMLKK